MLKYASGKVKDDDYASNHSPTRTNDAIPLSRENRIEEVI